MQDAAGSGTGEGVSFSLAGGLAFLLMMLSLSLETSCHVNKPYLVLLTLQPTQEKKRIVWALSLC